MRCIPIHVDEAGRGKRRPGALARPIFSRRGPGTHEEGPEPSPGGPGSRLEVR